MNLRERALKSVETALMNTTTQKTPQGQATPEGAEPVLRNYMTQTSPMGKRPSNEVEPSTGYIGHTPGPWKKGTPGHGRFCVYGGSKGNGRGICVMSNTQTIRTEELAKYGDHPLNLEADANARLIAAAPDLLEALQSVERVLSTYSDKIESWQWHMLKSVRSAVAKAEAK